MENESTFFWNYDAFLFRHCNTVQLMMKLVYNVDFFIDTNTRIIEARQFCLQLQTNIRQIKRNTLLLTFTTFLVSAKNLQFTLKSKTKCDQ